MNFKKWLEDATSTACVANFAQPLFTSQPSNKPKNDKDKKKKHDSLPKL